MAKTRRRCVGGSRTTAALGAALLVLTGCGAAADEELSGPELELVEIARLDGSAAAGGAGFGRIADLEIGGDGTVYVLDGLNRVVHAYGRDGTPVGTFGRRGGGPGELEQPVALIRGPGGLWVVDARNARYTVYDGAGALVGTYRSLDADVFHPLAAGFGADGRLYTVALDFGRLEEPAAVLVEGAAGDDEVRTVRRVALPFVTWPPPFQLRGEGMMVVLPVPYSPEPAFQVDDGGRLWYASTGDPWVQRRAPDGELEGRYGRDFAAPPVTAAERQAALEDGELEELRTAAGPAGVAELGRRIPAAKPHLRGFFVDDEGNVWIMRTPSSAAGEAVSRMEVYDSAGALVGVARAPLASEPRPRVRSRLLAGVVRDELGVESVVLYEIR